MRTQAEISAVSLAERIHTDESFLSWKVKKNHELSG